MWMGERTGVKNVVERCTGDLCVMPRDDEMSTDLLGRRLFMWRLYFVLLFGKSLQKYIHITGIRMNMKTILRSKYYMLY